MANRVPARTDRDLGTRTQQDQLCMPLVTYKKKTTVTAADQPKAKLATTLCIGNHCRVRARAHGVWEQTVEGKLQAVTFAGAKGDVRTVFSQQVCTGKQLIRG